MLDVISTELSIGILKKMDVDKATSLISSWKIDIERVE